MTKKYRFYFNCEVEDTDTGAYDSFCEEEFIVSTTNSKEADRIKQRIEDSNFSDRGAHVKRRRLEEEPMQREFFAFVGTGEECEPANFITGRQSKVGSIYKFDSAKDAYDFAVEKKSESLPITAYGSRRGMRPFRYGLTQWFFNEILSALSITTKNSEGEWGQW